VLIILLHSVWWARSGSIPWTQRRPSSDGLSVASTTSLLDGVAEREPFRRDAERFAQRDLGGARA
jgi:hypothetical protein